MLLKDGVEVAFQLGLLQDKVGQGCQSFFASDAGACFALGTIGQVEVLYFLQGGGGEDGGSKFSREFALCVDESPDIGFTLMQCTQCCDAVGDGLNLPFVQAARHFFAIACNERNGVAFVEECYGACNRSTAEAQFGAECPGQLGHGEGLLGSHY